MTKETQPIKNDKIITKQESNLVTQGLDGIDESIDKSDISIPRIQIIQPTSRSGGTPGKLSNVATGEEFDSMDVVFLAVRKSRIRWEPSVDGKIDLDLDPLCRSKDSKFGEGDPGGECRNCPFQTWINNQRPECQLKYNFLGVDMETRMPFLMTVGGTSFREGKKVLTKAVLNKVPLYSFKVHIEPQLMQSARGKYYVYLFSIKENVDKEYLEEFTAMKQEFDSQAFNQEVNEKSTQKEKPQNKQPQEDLPTIQVEEDKKEEEAAIDDDGDIKVNKIPF